MQLRGLPLVSLVFFYCSLLVRSVLLSLYSHLGTLKMSNALKLACSCFFLFFKLFLKCCCNVIPWFLGLTVTLWPEASLSEHRAECVPRTGRWGWGWGWAEWPQTGCSSGPPPGRAAGHPSSRCSSEPAAPPHRMFSVPASWRRATSFKTRRIQIFWSGLPWSRTQTEENKAVKQHHKIEGHRVYS